MDRTSRLLTLVLAGALLGVGGCAGSGLDDGDSADVVLFVQTLTVPPVTTAPDPSAPGTCVFTVTNATATLLNKPKNATAASPFQDIVLQDVVISYQWDDEATPGGLTPTRILPLSGTVEVGKTASVQFPPILLGDLTPDRAGHSASLSMTFRGRTVEGRPVSSPPSGTAGTALGVNSCLAGP